MQHFLNLRRGREGEGDNELKVHKVYKVKSKTDMADISIIYEDENVVAISKPSGLVIHPARSADRPTCATSSTAGRPDGSRDGTTLVDWILEHYPEMKDVGEPLKLQSGEEILRPGIVHRLDKDTSGILLLARTEESFLSLKKQFQEKEITKVYRAIVYGEINDPVGAIEKPIGRNKKDFRLRSTQVSARGVLREARTEYKVISKNKNYTLVELYPMTGRTHQLRVHLASIGHPVVCDLLYGKGRECPPALARLGLHASSVEFKTLEGGILKLEVPLPKEMAQAIEVLLPE